MTSSSRPSLTNLFSARQPETLSVPTVEASDDFESMVGDLRRVFLSWLKSTELQLSREKQRLETDRTIFEDEKAKAAAVLAAERQKEVDRLRDERRRAEIEMQSQLKQVQVERDEVRKRLAEDRKKFEAEIDFERQRQAITRDELAAKIEQFKIEKAQIASAAAAAVDVVELNIGGTVFETTKDTLTRDLNADSLLVSLVSGKFEAPRDRSGRLFLDRDGELFRDVLNFLRNPARVPPTPKDSTTTDLLVAEAKFYGVKFFPFPLAFAIGGHDGEDALRTCEVLDVVNQCWRATRPMATSRVYFGAAAGLNSSKLYAFGGQNVEYSCLAETEVYDPLRDVWSIGPSLSTPRRNCAGVSTLDGRILSIGGFDGLNILSSVEALDVRMKNWVNASPLTVPRSSAVAANLPDGRVIVAGGTDGSRLRSVEVWDPRMNKWEKANADMNQVRSASSLVSLVGRVFAVGGVDAEQNVHASLEMFEEELHAWSYRQSCITPRVDLSACAVDGTVMISGGQSDGLVHSTVEFYQPDVDSWQEGPAMLFPRYGHCNIALDV